MFEIFVDLARQPLSVSPRPRLGGSMASAAHSLLPPRTLLIPGSLHGRSAFAYSPESDLKVISFDRDISTGSVVGGVARVLLL